jgi:hypothetical protein
MIPHVYKMAPPINETVKKTEHDWMKFSNTEIYSAAMAERILTRLGVS